jgi:hypothetical protein
MIRLRHAVLAGSALVIATSAAGAQTRRTAVPVPASMIPSAGLCRVWIEGVAPTRQPAVTDCATARANLRSNSRVIYGGSSNGRYAVATRDDRTRYEARQREEARLREQARLRNDGRYYNDNDRRQRELQKAEEKRRKAIEKAERKRHKEWEKSRKHDGDDHDDHRRGDSHDHDR